VKLFELASERLPVIAIEFSLLLLFFFESGRHSRNIACDSGLTGSTGRSALRRFGGLASANF
jgi:hypothetical protein